MHLRKARRRRHHLARAVSVGLILVRQTRSRFRRQDRCNELRDNLRAIVRAPRGRCSYVLGDLSSYWRAPARASTAGPPVATGTAILPSASSSTAEGVPRAPNAL